MGQALEMCRICPNPRACCDCVALHEWIIEHMEPKWISANDKSPEKSRDENDELIKYITYIPEYGVGIGYYIKPLDRWVRNGKFADVTHWMPLPKPPEEESDENIL